MSSSTKTDFGILCRELRVARGLTQKQVADGVGIKATTYGNLESAAHRVIGRDAAHRIANFHDLDAHARKNLIALWEATPLSAFSEKRKAQWERRNRMRSKAKHHDRLFLSLIEVLGAFLPNLPEEQACTCRAAKLEDDFEFGGDPGSAEPQAYTTLCEVCSALYNLGLHTYTTKDKVMADLARLQDKLEARVDQAAAEPAR